MADYSIVGHAAVRGILSLVRPYVIVKKRNVEVALSIISAAEKIRNGSDLVAVAEAVDRYALLNYSKGKTVTSKLVAQHVEGSSINYASYLSLGATDSSMDP